MTTKRSPIVLIGKFATVEAIGLFLYFIATLFGDSKFALYSQLSFSSLLSYQTAKVLFLSSAQFILTIYAFFLWYYEEYSIQSDHISHTWGVFRRKEKRFPITASASFTISYNVLGKFLHFGSLKIREGERSFTIATISRPPRVLHAILHGENNSSHTFKEVPKLSALLASDEHDQLEFKSSLRFDYRSEKPSRDIEKASMKTIAAFLNSKGGQLVIGVNDARLPIGIQNDYRTLQRKDRDGFENHFTQTFNSMIGPEFRNYVKLSFHEAEGHDICVAHVLPSPRPVYLKADNNEHFYMRTGNTSTSLRLSEIESYARSRWPERVSLL